MELPTDFRCLADFPGYAVSAGGRILSCWNQRGRIVDCWHEILPRPNGRGYLHVMLVSDNQRKSKRSVAIHRLVLSAFVGSKPSGMQCCHNNGNGLDNRLENLRYDSQSENNRDKARHGKLGPVGEKNGQTKLTGTAVDEIRQLFELGKSCADIARLYRVSRQHVSNICHRKWRKHG